MIIISLQTFRIYEMYVVCVCQGYGWAVGQIREILSTLIDKYRHVQPKQPDYTYNGPMIGASIS